MLSWVHTDKNREVILIVQELFYFVRLTCIRVVPEKDKLGYIILVLSQKTKCIIYLKHNNRERFQWLCIILVIMYCGTCIVQYLYCTNHLKFTSGEISTSMNKRPTIVLYMLYVLNEELNWYILPVAFILPLEA